MASSLENFGLHEMLKCSNGIRGAMRDARTFEDAAQQACQFLYDELRTDEGLRACALIRIYKTHSFSELEPALQRFARRVLPKDAEVAPTLRCLTLLGTVGDRDEWNDRRQSEGHQAIPLPSAAVVERAPMVAAMIRAFGIDIAAAVNPAPEVMRDMAGKTYGVFHVVEAQGSANIPAQDFVRQARIRSVIGFGGSLALGDLFAALIFTRVRVDHAAADRFRTIALDLKSRFFGFSSNEIFNAAPPE